MPVPVIVGEPRSVKTDDQTGMPQSDLGDRLLEAQPLSIGGSRFAEIVVDHALRCTSPLGGAGRMLNRLSAPLRAQDMGSPEGSHLPG